MTLSEITLHHFRSYEEARFAFSRQVTIISGPNGSGKTNILEAIYTLCAGKSFRDSDGSLTQFEAPWWRVEGQVDEVRRDVRFDPSRLPSKQLVIDDVKKSRFTYREQLPVVLFEPEDLRLIDGSPSRRRDFLDRILVQLSPHYRRSLRAYERSLTQRNNLLKQSHYHDIDDTLFVWDVSLAEHGARLIEERRELIRQMNESLSGLYSTIADTEHQVEIRYDSPIGHKDTMSSLLTQLKKHSTSDRQRGFTSVGPHREDIVFLINGHDAATSASRGEVRSIVLSLKLIEAKLYEERYETAPLLLFDDVFSELDETRRAKLLEAQADMQLILTTTDADIAAGYKARHIKLA
jgi:DNA replication and repair protein RecF